MINRSVIVGRLTKDVELKYTPQGVPMARFTVAVNRPFSNGQGEKQADFISCIAWRKQAENLANYTAKGHLIGVEGRITTGSYEDKDGKKVYTTDVNADSVQFLEPKGNGQSNQNQNSSYGNTGGASYNQSQNQSQQGNYQQPQAQGNYQQPQQNTGANYGNQGGNYQQQQNPQGQQQNWQQPQQQQNQNYGQPPYNNGGNQPMEVSENDLPF